MARLAGFEPTTPWFVAKYSIQLSYRREARIIAEASPAPLLPPVPRHRHVAAMALAAGAGFDYDYAGMYLHLNHPKPQR